MTRFVLSLLLAMWSCFGAAAPRIGSHDGYTRLVFELPAKMSPPTSGQLSGQTYTVQLSRALPSESGVVSAPGLSRWTIQGQRITLNLRGSGQPKLSALPAAAGQAARLIIDVPISAKTFAGKKVTRSTSPSSPVTVVIDPGHGGVFPGMSSQWVVEKNITMDVALRVRSKLEARGVKVILTRSGDTQISTNLAADLEARSRLANNGKVGAFISIHVNAGGSGAQGIETYYFGAPMAGSSRSLAVEENGGGSLGLELTKRASTTAQNLLGDLVAQAKLTFSRDLAAKVQQNLVQATGAVNRGVRSDTFVVILHPTTPAILTEIGFGSSPTEGPKLASAAYRDQIAAAIAGAIASYLHVP